MAEDEDMTQPTGATAQPTRGTERRRAPTRSIKTATGAVKTGRTTSVRREGAAPAAAAAPPKASTTKKLLFFSMPVLALVAIIGGFFFTGGGRHSVWKLWAIQFGLMEDDAPPPKPVGKDRKPLDQKYDVAMQSKGRAEFFVNNVAKAVKDDPAKQTLEEIEGILKKLEDLKKAVEAGLEGAAELAAELAKPEGTTLSDEDNLRVNTEFQEYQKYNKVLGGELAFWKDLYQQKGGKIAETAPPPSAFNARKLHAWGRYGNGVWARHRIVIRDGGDVRMWFKDTGLKSGGTIKDAEFTLASERFADGESKGVSDESGKWTPDGLAVAGEEALTIDGKPLKCTVVQAGAEKLWVAREGRGADWLVVKREGPAGGLTVTSIAENESHKVGGRAYNCLRFDANLVEKREGEDVPSAVRTWIREDVYGGVVTHEKRTGERVETHTLVATGENWEKRPAFPTETEPPSDEGAGGTEAPKESAVAPPEPPRETPPPAPEPPKETPPPTPDPPKEPDPRPAPQDAATDPWSNEKVGSWFRMRTSMSGMEMFSDTGFVDRGSDFYVLAMQQFMMGNAQAETKQRIELKGGGEPEKPAREENVEVGGTGYPCEVYERSGTTSWIVKEGPYKRTVLRMDSAQMKLNVKKLDRAAVRVKDRTFDCIVVEAEQDVMGQKSEMKAWNCPAFPLWMVRMESSMSTMGLVDYGDDWSKRPPFPAAAEPAPPTPPPDQPTEPKPDEPKPDEAKPDEPKPDEPKPEEPKPEEPKAQPPPPPRETPKPAVGQPKTAPTDEKSARTQKKLDEAATLLKDAVPLFEEVAEAMPTLPPDSASLKDLLRRAELCERKLYDAQLRYTLVKGDAPDPARIDRRIRTLDKLLSDVKLNITKIKARMGR